MVCNLFLVFHLTYQLQEIVDELKRLNMCYFFRIFLISTLLSGIGCTVMKTEHHITLDHNISIKIEQEVNDFLDDLYGDDSGTN